MKMSVDILNFHSQHKKKNKLIENVQRVGKTKDKVPIANIILSVVTNHLDEQVPSVLSAWAQFGLSLRGVGANEEQPTVPDLGQWQVVMEVSDAAGSWKVLETRGDQI